MNGGQHTNCTSSPFPSLPASFPNSLNASLAFSSIFIFNPLVLSSVPLSDTPPLPPLPIKSLPLVPPPNLSSSSAIFTLCNSLSAAVRGPSCPAAPPSLSSHSPGSKTSLASVTNKFCVNFSLPSSLVTVARVLANKVLARTGAEMGIYVMIVRPPAPLFSVLLPVAWSGECRRRRMM